MKHNQSLEKLSSNLLNEFDKEFQINKPDLAIVQGDTSTAFIAALSAFYKKIPVAHIEAGLRTNNIYDPFPEEVNRRLISQIASLHFSPTINSQKLLESIGFNNNVYTTGNTVIDALNIISKSQASEIKGLEYENCSLILVSVHEERTGERF